MIRLRMHNGRTGRTGNTGEIRGDVGDFVNVAIEGPNSQRPTPIRHPTKIGELF